MRVGDKYHWKVPKAFSNYLEVMELCGELIKVRWDDGEVNIYEICSVRGAVDSGRLILDETSRVKKIMEYYETTE